MEVVTLPTVILRTCQDSLCGWPSGMSEELPPPTPLSSLGSVVRAISQEFSIMKGKNNVYRSTVKSVIRASAGGAVRIQNRGPYYGPRISPLSFICFGEAKLSF